MHGILAIYLKGLTLSALYPFPDLRTMAGIDILVCPADQERAVAALSVLGCKLDIAHSNDKHLHCTKAGALTVEVHQSLLSNVSGTADIEAAVWSKRQSCVLGGQNMQVPDDEDTIVYLILHLVQHIHGFGFGVKQLCDLVLFLEIKKPDLNRFEAALRPYQADAFFRALLPCSRKLFNYRPDPSANSLPDTDTATRGCSDRIYAFRRRLRQTREIRQSSKLYADYIEPGAPISLSNRLKAIRRIILPSYDELAHKYTYYYIRKHPVLLPWDWLHRVFRLITRTDYSVDSKYFFMVKGKNDARVKALLLRQLGL